MRKSVEGDNRGETRPFLWQLKEKSKTMRKVYRSVIIEKHSKKCFMRNKTNPWSGIIKGSFYGNYRANSKATHGRHHLWYNVLCNDPHCPAIKAVHSEVLANCE